MTRYTPITAATAGQFPAGTKVRFFNGCGWHLEGPQYEDGIVLTHLTDRWGTKLLVQTESGQIREVSGITTSGIGCYLREDA